MEIRHTPTAPTRAQLLASGGEIDAHRHDDHQIVYAARGVLAVTTDKGSWVAPSTRAIWVPAGAVHAHRAYGELDLHLVGLPATDNPLDLDTHGSGPPLRWSSASTFIDVFRRTFGHTPGTHPTT